MSTEDRVFYGKDVTEAIRNATETMGVAQENLDIEVVETGSTGIFGLIRKKAQIRVTEKVSSDESDDLFAYAGPSRGPRPAEETGSPEQFQADDGDDGEVDPELEVPLEPEGEESPVEGGQIQEEDEDEDEIEADAEQGGEVSEESIAVVRDQLLAIVDLMQCPSTLEIATSGMSLTCTLRGDFEEQLAGTDGKVLDSLQYLMRKIVARKVPEQLRLIINVGDFRERRLDELKARAVEMAAQVKADGKTQVLPALNPSERRAVHMVLQEDKEIRSRSVGDGLFKKILIYKPGKGGRPPARKRHQGKGRQGAGNGKARSDN